MLRKSWFYWLAACLMTCAFSYFMESCATSTLEDIRASQDSIVFHRSVGRRAATGGFMLSKDSLVMSPIN